MFSEIQGQQFGFSNFFKSEMNNNTQKILFFPNKFTLRPLICVEIKLTLRELWMCRVWWTPCGNYPWRSCGTEVCVLPLHWSHANTTFQHTKQHSSNISYTICTQRAEKWKEKSDNTSYLRLLQACTQPHIFFSIPRKSQILIYLKHSTIFIDTQKHREKHLWLRLFSGSMLLSNILTISNLKVSHYHSLSANRVFRGKEKFYGRRNRNKLLNFGWQMIPKWYTFHPMQKPSLFGGNTKISYINWTKLSLLSKLYQIMKSKSFV